MLLMSLFTCVGDTTRSIKAHASINMSPNLVYVKKAKIVLKRCRALHMLNSSMSLALKNMRTQVYAKLTNILYVCVCVSVHVKGLHKVSTQIVK